MAHVIIWAFRPQPGRETEFERTYGPDGDWVQLFRSTSGYIGTELLKPVDETDRYLVIDRRESPAAYKAFLAEQQEEYARLDRACEKLTAEETELGRFSYLS